MSDPQLVVHADWSIHPQKRWMASAQPVGRHWTVTDLSVAPALSQWVADLENRARSGAGPVLVGFDFPIGVPAAYASRVALARFPDLFEAFGTPPWDKFDQLCRKSSEIDLHRPFYPFAPGGTKRDHLMSALGLDGSAELLRRCEGPQPYRPAASPLFWTLGAKQVGRAALCGWRDVLIPLRRRAPEAVGLWPFDGTLDDLLRDRGLVAVETYPADVYHRLGFPPNGWSKRRQSDRKARVAEIETWTRDREILLESAVKDVALDGFGPGGDGEDAFDALVGLLGMLQTLEAGDADTGVRGLPGLEVEGWIFGLRPALDAPAAGQ